MEPIILFRCKNVYIKRGAAINYIQENNGVIQLLTSVLNSVYEAVKQMVTSMFTFSEPIVIAYTNGAKHTPSEFPPRGPFGQHHVVFLFVSLGPFWQPWFVILKTLTFLDR